MGQYGFLISDRYVREVPGEVDMNISSIFFGFSLGVAVFSVTKASQQTWRAWKRRGRVTSYVAMIWGVWFSSMVLGSLAWTFQRQYIDPSFMFYFCVALFWAIQVQLLLQIIINRLGLLMVKPGRATHLKWLVFSFILAINISVFIIWMPARLQINEEWIYLNTIWDRCEKVIFAVVDGALNAYFIYLVRSRLIGNGLTKYIPLFRMNLFLIFISMSLDVALVGLMSLKSSLVYLSFHPVCYLLKLQIEMKMAELITKIVRSSGATGHDDYRGKSLGNTTMGTATMGTTTATNRTAPAISAHGALSGNTANRHVGESDSSIDLDFNESQNVMSTVAPPGQMRDYAAGYSPVSHFQIEDSQSRTSSMQELARSSTHGFATTSSMQELQYPEEIHYGIAK